VAAVPGEAAPHPAQPELLKQKSLAEISKPEQAEEFSDSYTKSYQNNGGNGNDIKDLHPLGMGGPDKIGAFKKFRNAVEKSWIDTREFVENDWERVRRLMNNKDINITPESDPYTAEILMHGRMGSRVEEAVDIVKKVDKDILATAKTAKVTDAQLSDTINRYLQTRHAPERNAQIGLNAAGMSTTHAENLMKEIEALPYFKDVERIANELQDLNNRTLDVLLKGEVIDKELYDLLRKTYKNHVPLNRVFDDTEDIGSAIAGRPFDVKSTGIFRAKGSMRKVADIQANIVSSYDQAIIRAEKNRVDLATLKFARENKDIGIFEEFKPKAVGKTFDGRIILERIDDPQVLQLREAGKPIHLRITDPSLALALRGVNRLKLDITMRLVRSVTRFYASLATRFNPEFAFPNKIRDLQEAMVYAMSKGEVGYYGAAKIPLKDPASFKAVTDYVLGKDSEGARLYKQMKFDGGTTGGLGLSTRQQVQLDIDQIRKTNRSNPARAAQKIVETVDAWNQIFEDSTRFSVYKVALENDIPRPQAARLAKESSINFNKFGRGGPVINALYMFANASIQGSVKMLRAMRNPKVAATITSAVIAAVVAASEWNDSVDPDWRDKVTTWDRLNSLPVMIPSLDGGVRYISIPVSWGIKPIKVAADYGYDAMNGKLDSITDAMSGELAAIMEGYNPIGGTDITSAITPTILDLPSDIARNRAWHGGKIRPDWDEFAPASIQYFESLGKTTTGQTTIVVSQGMSGIGIEVSPADINYAYETLIGGAGRAVSKFLNTISSISQGGWPRGKEIPFVSRFYRERTTEEVGTGNKEYEDMQKIRGEQSRQRFILNQQAENAWNQLSAIPREEANRRYHQIKEEDPALAKKIVEISKDDKLGLTYTDRLIKQRGVENGMRARYLFGKFQELKTNAEKHALWKELSAKGILTEKTKSQIKYLLKGGT